VSASAPDHASETPHVDHRRLTRERLAWAAALLVAAVLAAALAVVHLTEVPERPRPVRFASDAPAGWSFADFGWPAPSPDGRQVVFVAQPDPSTGSAGPPMLWIRSLDSLEARSLAGTEWAEGVPIWSPDSKSIAFFAKGELRRLNLSEGTVQTICAKPSECTGCGEGGFGGTGGGDWSREGTILFSAGGYSARIYAVPATGGEAKPLTTLDVSRGETNHHIPQFLPDGRRFLFLISATKPEAQGLHVAALDTPAERRQVAPTWAHSVYASRHLLFARDGTLFAQPFDAQRAERSGEPVTIATSVATWTVSAALAWFGVSEGGTIAFFSGVSGNGQVQLAWLDRKGGGLGSVSAPDRYGQIALSPDGRNVAVEISDVDNRQADLWVIELARGVMNRVTATPDIEANPVWAPDGRSLAFSVWGHGKLAEVRRKGLRVSDPETVLVDTPEEDHAESWSADGKTLFFLRRTTSGGSTLTAWALPLGGGDPVQVARAAGAKADEPQLSPDGRWLAYMSDESGRYEVYVEPFRREGDRVRVSVDGGGQPKWRGDGRELFYVTPSRRLMAVGVQAAGERLDVGRPTELFELRGFTGLELDDYAPTADGQRFLVKLPVQEQGKAKLQVVTNWPSLVESPTR
jgi:Tol biopolymer transport system component